MRYVTVVNRTTKNLTGIWDGRQYTIVPGKNSFNEVMATKFKSQNPLMGSEDPFTLERIYLLGIEEDHDDCTPLEQSQAVELVDRSKLGGKPVDVVPGNPQGLYSRKSAAFKELPVENAFVKP